MFTNESWPPTVLGGCLEANGSTRFQVLHTQTLESRYNTNLAHTQIVGTPGGSKDPKVLSNVFNLFVRCVRCTGLTTEDIERRIVVGDSRVAYAGIALILRELANDRPLRSSWIKTPDIFVAVLSCIH